MDLLYKKQVFDAVWPEIKEELQVQLDNWHNTM